MQLSCWHWTAVALSKILGWRLSFPGGPHNSATAWNTHSLSLKTQHYNGHDKFSSKTVCIPATSAPSTSPLASPHPWQCAALARQPAILTLRSQVGSVSLHPAKTLEIYQRMNIPSGCAMMYRNCTSTVGHGIKARFCATSGNGLVTPSQLVV